MAAQKRRSKEAIRGAQSKAGQFGQAQNTEAQTVPDGFEARQAGEKLKDKKGQGQSSGDEKGEGIPIGWSQTTWLFM